MGIIKRIAGKIRGKALKVVVTGVVTLGCLVLGVNLPEPARMAIISGTTTVIEAVTAETPEAVDSE